MKTYKKKILLVLAVGTALAVSGCDRQGGLRGYYGRGYCGGYNRIIIIEPHFGGYPGLHSHTTFHGREWGRR